MTTHAEMLGCSENPKGLFGMPLRPSTETVASLLEMAKLDWPLPIINRWCFLWGGAYTILLGPICQTLTGPYIDSIRALA